MEKTKTQLDQHDQSSEEGVTISDSLERLRAIARGEDVPQIVDIVVPQEPFPPLPACADAHCGHDHNPNLKTPTVAETMAADAQKGGQKQLTLRQFKQLRRAYFTIRHPYVRECGHKMDQINQPKNNCEYCWFAFFSSHGELVQTADRAFQEQGAGFLDAMRGVKFRKLFLRYMSTMAKFQREAEALKEQNGEQGREAGSESGEAEGSGSVRPTDDQGAEAGSSQGSGFEARQAVRIEGDVSTPGQERGQTTSVDTQ